tara:strand:+ start:278 stop:991 length:714 start_codon:yes stop_codon:yes gene_type:complete
MENIFILNKLEKDVLNMLSDKLLDISINHDTDTYLYTATLFGIYIPDRLRTFIQDFKNNKLKDDVFIIKNLPIDDITQDNNTHFIGENTKLSRCQAILNQSIGEMVAYEAETDGNFFQDIIPNKQLKYTQNNLDSNIELELYAEHAVSNLKPDYISLACLKEDNNIKIYYNREHYILEKGDLIILNNNKLVDRKFIFTLKINDSDIFIIRSFMIHHLNQLKDKTKETNERIVKTLFS